MRAEGGPPLHLHAPRVAVINSHPIQHFAPLWRAVTARGEIELKVFYCTDWGVNEYRDPGFGTTFRWDVDLMSGYASETLPIARRPESLGFWEVDNPAVGGALDAFDPDVLILFGYSFLTNWRALAWARARARTSARDVRVLLFSDSELKHDRGAAARLAKEVVVRGFYAMTDGAMPIGNCNADYYRHYGLPSRALFGCPYPVDGGRFLASVGDVKATRAAIRRERGIAEDDFVFASVGKYIPRKRHADVARAFLELPAEERGRARALFIGDGPGRPELEELARLGEGRIDLTGFINQSRMPAYFAACDALIVASEMDPHPLVVTEALFLGLPVLVSDKLGCIGPDDTVRDGENGVVYPCGDVGALSAAMSRLLRDRELYNRFSESSRRIAPSQDTSFAAKKLGEAVRAVMSQPRATVSERARRLLPH